MPCTGLLLDCLFLNLDSPSAVCDASDMMVMMTMMMPRYPQNSKYPPPGLFNNIYSKILYIRNVLIRLPSCDKSVPHAQVTRKNKK